MNQLQPMSTNGRSWLREALNTMQVKQPPRVWANVLRMLGALGSSVAETCCVCRIDTIQDLRDMVAGRALVPRKTVDLAVKYYEGLWWWNCLRERRPLALDAYKMAKLRRDLDEIWPDLPQLMKDDFEKAKKNQAQRKEERKQTPGHGQKT